MDLNCSIRDAADHFSGKQLAGRRLGAHVLSAVAFSGGFKGHAFRGVGLSLGVCQHALYQLLFSNWLAKLFALQGVFK